MASATNLATFHDPTFSLLQAAIHQTLLKHSLAGRITLPKGHRGLGVTAEHPYMQAAVQAMQQMQTQPSTPAQAAGPVAAPQATVIGTVADCAKLVAEIAWDEVFDHSKVAALKNELVYSECDPFWAETLVVYEEFLASGKTQTYTVYSNINDYVLSDLQDTTKVAIIADWGTGMNDALVLLQQVAGLGPDVLIHLGDIYYAGLPAEDDCHFGKLIAEVWPKDPPLVFTLDGNHDRYAGTGGGYYKLIAGLNGGKPAQPNSYFALRNNFWQFLAMDTGYHDTDPYTVASNLTYLEPSEVQWHVDKVRNNGVGVDTSINPSGVRGTILLSHHQLMSFAGVGKDSAGQPLAVNPNLATAFSPVFPQIDFWLWGHEHNLCIFQPYTMAPGQPLPPGRCVGASAVPMFTPASPPPSNLSIPPGETGPPQIEPNTELGNNGTVFNHSYALVTLNQASLTINYYQFDSTDATPGNPPAAVPMSFSDSVTGPLVAKPK